MAQGLHLAGQMGRESYDIKFELCELIHFYPKIFFLLFLVAKKLCVHLPNSAVLGQAERIS